MHSSDSIQNFIEIDEKKKAKSLIILYKVGNYMTKPRSNQNLFHKLE